MVLQTVVNHQGTFTHVNASWVGSVCGTHVFQNLGLGMLVESECFVPRVEDIEMGTVGIPLLIRDPAYLLLPWLMRLYTRHLDPWQVHFNWCLGLNQCPP